MSDNFNKFNDESDLDAKNIYMTEKITKPIINKNFNKSNQLEENILEGQFSKPLEINNRNGKVESHLSIEVSDAFFERLASKIK